MALARNITVTLLVLFFVFGDSVTAFSQTAPKRIYIAPDDHTDYMWTADEEQYRESFLRMLDYYLNLADQTQSNPAPYQSRWNADGSFWLWTYERNKSAADFERLMNRIRSGHISAPLNALVSTYGGQPAEAVLRGMYYSGRLERRYNLRFPQAAAMENQTLPFGLASLWAGSGAKYSWRGVCSCVTRVPAAGSRENEIYRYTGPDGASVLMKWNSIFPGNVPSGGYDSEGIGGYAEARYLQHSINFVDTNSAFRAKYPYPVIGLFGKGWDDRETLTDEFVTTAQTLSNPNRQLIVSNQEDFFLDFETNHGANLPAESCSYGNEWDLYCASLAETSASVKRNVEKLRSAEALATFVSLKNPQFISSAARITARDNAFMNLGLYWEHDWTADGPVGRDNRRDWQRRVANSINSYVDNLQTDAGAELGKLIARPQSGNTRFYVFNSLSWQRSDFADVPYTDTNPVHVVEAATGTQVPSQIVNVNGTRFLRVLASNVPSVGYKTFEIRAGAGNTAFSNAATVMGNVIETSRYRITVAPRGAITSLYDKTRNREFAREINGRFINDFGAGGGTLEVENVGPVSVTLKTVSSEPLTHTTRITFFRNLDRIDIHNDITQNFGDVRTWGFGFNLDAPDVRHEEVGAIARARTKANGGDYSNRTNNTRYDWLTLNHYADVTGTGNVGITLSNADCYFMQLGSSTSGALDTATPQINVLAGGQVDGTNLGIQNQGGDSRFLQRFAVRTHGTYNQTSAMRFALEHQNPFSTGIVTGTATNGSLYPENSFSLLTVSNSNVLLWSLKPAEEGIAGGVIARVWNQSNSAASYNLKLNSGVTAAKKTTHIETDVSDVAVSNNEIAVTAARQQLQTYRLLSIQTPPPASVVYAVNAGGGAVGNFAADGNFSGGNTFSISSPITVADATTAPLEIYQSERYGNFNYNIGGLVPGSAYTVRLHFAEIWWGVDGRGGAGNGAGQRIMNVNINGSNVLANFDVFAAAGGAERTVVREFVATANSSGSVIVNFAPATNSPDQNAKVSGIEILTAAQLVSMNAKKIVQ